jgi:hypothetical protein
MTATKTLDTIEEVINHAAACLTNEEIEQRLYFLTNTIAPTDQTVKITQALRQHLNARSQAL